VVPLWLTESASIPHASPLPNPLQRRGNERCLYIIAIFNFFKTKREEQIKERFVGRYEWVLIIRQILGEIVSEIEMQIAVIKDIGERNEVLERIVKLENYIHSEYFTTQLDVSSAHKDINSIIDL
jgi:hypothetical protein